jgi:hypothetical protein
MMVDPLALKVAEAMDGLDLSLEIPMAFRAGNLPSS